MSTREETDASGRSRAERRVHESETVIPNQDAGAGEGPSAAASDAAPGGVVDAGEFARALIEIGLIDAATLEAFAADSAEGVLGLSRALVKAGKLTPYQAAAVYQKKSRGLLIGNYLILDKLGQGGMGVVFLARHRRLGRVGALKILPPSFARDRDAVLRFRREVEAAGRLKHPNLVAAQDSDEDRGVHFLVMDYVEGRDLDHIVRDRGPMQITQAVDCLIQAARGLEAAHAQGIIHRDIKPGNLMLDDAGTVRVLDLGLARIVDASNPFSKSTAGRLTQSGMYMGTIDYMAPEQAEDSHRVDHRADIYSLGCTLFYLLTGREPFPGETVLKRLIAHMEHPAPSLLTARPAVSRALEATYQKMVAKRPSDRPASMTEVISLLEAAKVTSSDAKEADVAPPKTRPDLMVFDEAPLKRAAPPRTKAEPSILARREEPEGLLISHELNLEDLVMDVRREAAPAPLPPARKPAAAQTQPLKRSAPTRSRGRPSRRSVVVSALAAIVVMGALFVRFVLFPGPVPTSDTPQPSRPELEGEFGLVPRPGSEQRQPVALEETVPDPGQLIFDGTSGHGWMLCDHKPVPSRNIEPDGLNPHGTGSYLVVYDQKLGDFVLDFEYKLTRGCNSGVFLRVSDLNNPIYTGIEVALDDIRRGDSGDSGGFFSLVAPKVFAQKPAGEWNRMTITVAGPRLAVSLNGTEVSDINLDVWTVPGKRPDGTDQKFKNVAIANLARTGYLGFQDLGGDCWFKNIVLRKPTKPAVRSPAGTIAGSRAPEPTRPTAPVAPAPTTPKAAIAGPHWVLIGDGNRFAGNMPDDSAQMMADLAKDGAQIKSFAFRPGGGWVIFSNRARYNYLNIGDEPLKAIEELGRRGEELKSIAFTRGGGWALLHGRNGFEARNIPDDVLKALGDLRRRRAELKSIAFGPGGACVIVFGRIGFYQRRISDEALKALGDIARSAGELKSFTFGPDGGFSVLYGRGMAYSRNIGSDPYKALGDLGSKGELRGLSFSVRALNRLSQDDRATRDWVLERMAQFKVPGLSIALVNKFQVEWARGYGVMRAGSSEPVTTETRFQAASISKAVAGVAALRLVQQGKLDLDQPLNDKLLAWKVLDNEFTRRKKPTLRQLLSHTAGFSVPGFGGYPPGDRLPTLIEIVNGKKPANSPPIRVEFIPGSKVQYSGGGYVVLQQLIMDITGKPFPSAVQELVLEPLAMSQSSFEQPPSAGLQATLAQGHISGVALPGRWQVYPELAAAGLWTTPSDLARFVIALQEAKRGGRDPILSSRMIAEMLRKQTGDYGLGVTLSGTGSAAAFNHSGGGTGFECDLIGFTETGQGAVLMTNADGGSDLIRTLVDELREEYDWPPG